MMCYILRVATAISQLFNALIGGHPDITLSARVYVAAALGNEKAARWEQRIDRMFFWQERHCRQSWNEGDVKHAAHVLQTQQLILQRQRSGEGRGNGQ
jgi:hypothetical protein